MVPMMLTKPRTWILAGLAAACVPLVASSQAPPRTTGPELLHVLGNFCNLQDSAGRSIYTSVLASVWAQDRPAAEDWVARLREAGSTHVFVNVPDGDWSYGKDNPDVAERHVWRQPDLWADLPRYRAFLEWLLAQPSANGRGFVPVIFLDHGGDDPLPRIGERWPRFAETMQDLLPHLVGVIAFEPVAGSWSSRELSEAMLLMHKLLPGLAMAWHGSPGRRSGASHPLEPDDPWTGSETAFFHSHGGEHIDVAFYQTPHGAALYEDCAPDAEDCWLHRWRTVVQWIGRGERGWRQLPVVLAETTAYEYIRGEATSEQAREIATRADRVCQTLGVRCGYGNGLPD
jgi:hypothetical protein